MSQPMRKYEMWNRPIIKLRGFVSIDKRTKSPWGLGFRGWDSTTNCAKLCCPPCCPSSVTELMDWPSQCLSPMNKTAGQNRSLTSQSRIWQNSCQVGWQQHDGPLDHTAGDSERHGTSRQLRGQISGTLRSSPTRGWKVGEKRQR